MAHCSACPRLRALRQLPNEQAPEEKVFPGPPAPAAHWEHAADAPNGRLGDVPRVEVRVR